MPVIPEGLDRDVHTGRIYASRIRDFYEQQLCPCYKEYQEFQKLVELKDTGLVVYCHRPHKENIRHGEAVDSVVNTSRDVFIVHNREDSTITTSELFFELEKKNISCPRCRKLFECAQKLLQEVKSIGRNIVMGICEHCRKKAQSIKMPFCACDEIVKKFLSFKGDQKEDIKKYVKICLSKMGHLLKDDIPLNKPKQLISPAYSELHIPHESEKINTMIPSTSLVDSDTTFVEKSVFVKEPPRTVLKERKKDEVFEDKPSMDARQVLKRRHDLSLRQRMSLEKDSGVPFTVSKRPDIYETNTQEKFHLQTVRFKKRQEEGRQPKLEQDQKKKLAQDDKKLKTEDKKQYAQDQKIVTKRDKSKEVNLKKGGLSDKTKKDVKGKPKSKGKGDVIGLKVAGIDSKQKEAKGEIPIEEKKADLLKLLAEHLIEKRENLKKKKEEEYEVQKAKEAAERKAKEAAERKAKAATEHKAKGSAKRHLKEEEAAERKAKEAAERKAKEAAEHEAKKAAEHEAKVAEIGQNSSFRPLMKKINLTRAKFSNITIGEKIFKYKRNLEKTEEQKGFGVKGNHQNTAKEEQTIPQETKNVETQSREESGMNGVVRYALSDRTFIDKGWTMLPTEKVVRKMNVYRMRPAHPEFNWFEQNKNKGLMTYDTGERLAEFDDNGRGRWYYRNGRLALDYYDAKETNAQRRFVVYSSGEPDEHGRTHPITTLATFDYLGNGIVFDHAGHIRLIYNQSEGEVLDRAIGPYTHWQWHSLNDPPVLQKVMIDTQSAHKDPNVLKLESSRDTKATRPDDEKILAIEFQNFIKEKSKKLSQKYQPFQIKMKALKINKHFSLKVLDQATVYLTFRDGLTNLKLNIGMKLDHQEIVEIDTAEIGEVSNSLKRFPARTDSLAELQHSVAYARHYERLHAERERWLRPPQPCPSVEQLTAGVSPPMRLPLRTVPTEPSLSTGYGCRKSTNSVYCSTRLRF